MALAHTIAPATSGKHMFFHCNEEENENWKKIITIDRIVINALINLEIMQQIIIIFMLKKSFYANEGHWTLWRFDVLTFLMLVDLLMSASINIFDIPSGCPIH